MVENEVYCSPEIDSFDINLGAGDDWLFFSTDKPGVLSGGTGDERFEAKAGADVVLGGEGSDTYIALPCPRKAERGTSGEPCDPVASSAIDTGPDTFFGGPGRDTADYSQVVAGASLSADGVANDGKPGEGDDIRPDVENIRGGPLSDRLAGSASDNELAGGGGDDTILGGSGQDLLDGGGGGDSLDGGVGSDRLFGREGADSASYAARKANVDVTLDDSANDGEAGERDQVGSDVENVIAGSGDDDVTGSSLANRLEGGGGEDFLDGRAGQDALLGGGATDVLRLRDGARDPQATCGPGTDFVIADPLETAARDCEDVDRVLSDNPALGRRVAVEPSGGSGVAAAATGKLRLRLPTSRRFVPLQDHLNLPVRSVIDAKAGRARVVSRAVGGRRPRQAGVFSAGLFQVLQSSARRRRGLTELRLKGSSFRRCRVSRGRAGSAARRYSRRTVRRLRGSGRGRFRTRGRYSAATVRGTAWTIADRCDGTLTRVRRGRVAVRDFRRRRTVLLRAGKSYLARPLR
ncbi:MAG: hypothetical protein M3131_00725 [Actinomycetota bacterium]|nr:hypothetical protein [Actinomycetota bacterium]